MQRCWGQTESTDTTCWRAHHARMQLTWQRVQHQEQISCDRGKGRDVVKTVGAGLLLPPACAPPCRRRRVTHARVQDLKSVDAGGTKAKGGMEAVPEAGLPPRVGEGLTGATKGEQRSSSCLRLLPAFCVCHPGPGSCLAAADGCTLAVRAARHGTCGALYMYALQEGPL